jgi:4,5-dihydroxyphthalate decarboxylase
MFRHSFITVNTQRSIPQKDLQGKRIGFSLYDDRRSLDPQTDAQYGVSRRSVGAGAANRSGTATERAAVLKAVAIENNTSDKSLSDLLEDGAIDAMIGSNVPKALGRNPRIARLFPNFPEVEADYYRRTGIYPIMHLVALKREVHERYPFVATTLYKAFCQAKDIALARMRFDGMLATMMP